MKKCIKCKIIKPIFEFTPRKERPRQYTVSCKYCRAKNAKNYRENNHSKVRMIEKRYQTKNRIELNKKSRESLRKKRKKNPDFDRAYKLKYTYGITIDEFNKILKKQEGKCVICRTDKPNGRGFCVDHDHKTGKVRGILCHSCNTGIGSLKDSVELLEKAIKYLKPYRFMV